ncbi:Holliday junction resolvase RuvX [Lachnospira multipara]|jgi:putative Holliday junction resolvase|uniref:Holliday junction resolvase RuvX n=1 Tax=Lachnospira multipara TaxID=28051 RepID=UPI0006878047|nr:Holliday junction resolvase RuvX [Lachnospira multipara]
MRYLGLDYGSKTVGVALSDPFGWTAQALETITRKEENKLRKTYARIEELIKEYEVSKVVVGLPKNMDDTEGERALLARDFAANIHRRTGIEIVMWDERLTTVAADEVLSEAGVKKENRKAVIDKIAAAFILQGYLDYEADKARKEIINKSES